MSRAQFPLSAWLDRIGYRGDLAPTESTLVALHRHHVHALPFENIDPFSGRPVSLDTAALEDKLLRRGRGGYCFELNTLFLRGLCALGYETASWCARVQVREGLYAARTHQITGIQIDGRLWLADVGFGGNGLVEAIPFELDREFDQGIDRFRIVSDSAYGFRLEHRLPGGWRTLYAFSRDPYLPDDFEVLNYFVSRAPEAVFTRIPICVRTTLTERRIVVADQFKMRSAGATRAPEIIQSAAALREILASQFGIALPEDYPLRAPPSAPKGLRDI